MPAKLTLFPNEGTSRHFVFREGRNHFLGRDPSSDLLLEDPRVSARHALFQWTGNDWILVDLRSKNGTSVNGSRITELPLQHEDWISFGGLVGCFERISEEKVQQLVAERASRLQSFVEARRDLDANLEPGPFLRRLMESVLQLTGARRGFVLLVAPTGQLDAEIASGFPPFEQLDGHFEESLGAIETVLRTGQRVVASSLRPDPLLPGKRSISSDLGKNTRACVPLKAEGRIIGLIYVDDREKGGVFSDLDLEILEALADHAALLIGAVRLEAPIRELLGVDVATVPAGSRSFLEELERKVGDIVRNSARRSTTSA
jgi:transcriptional regulator with GAF, ATPase, and Fis domain